MTAVPPGRRAVVLSLGLTATVFAVDCMVPLGVACAVPYTFAVLLALQAPDRRFGIAVAVLCCVLTFVKVALFPERGSTEMWKVIVNRFIAVFAVGMTTFLGLKRRRSDEQRREAEQRTRMHLADLAHMARLKTAGQLAATLAHELNQPLAAIALQADVARALSADACADVQTALSEIAEQSQRAAAIVRTVRGLVQKAEPERALLQLNELVHDVVRLIDAQFRQANVALELHLAAPDPRVLGDRIQLEQVLLNLLQNALDAMQAAGSAVRMVRVETALTGGLARVSVCDSGPGIAAGDVERIFERFYSTRPSGMGMGLAISRSIVEAHRGRLVAESRPGAGATFTFSLPRAAES